MILDVRTPEEWHEGHIAQAILLPVQDIMNGLLPDAKKNEEILIYCRSGARAGMAADLLQKQGYTNVQNIGGLNDALAAFGSLATGDD